MGSLSTSLSAAAFPQEVSVSLSLSGGFTATLHALVDYTPALIAAQETFQEIATALVPVDTGYLRSTIHANIAGLTLIMSAEAEYASYVEYGTWKMAAQSYFTPAAQQAAEVFCVEAQAILEEVQQELMDEVAGWNMSGGSIAALESQIDGQFMSSAASMAGSILSGILVGAAVAFVQAATGHDFRGND